MPSQIEQAAMESRLALFEQAVRDEIYKRKAQSKQKLWSKDKRPLTPQQWKFYDEKTHYKQQLFLHDESTLLALLCPRRTGKSTASLFKAHIATLEYPGSTIAYIVPTSKHHARRLFWRPLKELDAKFNLNLTFYESEKRVESPSKAQILLLGASDKDSPMALRGDAYSLVIMDECKDFGPHFEELMIEAVLPGLEDYGGQLVLAGTPGKHLEGLFYEITTGGHQGWSVHKWIKADNTFLRPEARDLDRIEEKEYKPFGLTKKSPKFRAEQLAEWCTDDTDRIYAYAPQRNDYEGHLPLGHDWMYVLGLDLGETDENAFIVGAFAATHRDLHQVAEYSRARMSIDEIAEKTQEYMSLYSPMVTMVADTGGYGRGIVTDLINRFGLPYTPAIKGRDKLGRIAVANTDLMAGRVKVLKDSKLSRELMRITKTYRPHDKKTILQHSDLGDAFLYMHGASLHWAHRSYQDDDKTHATFAHLTPEQIRMYKEEQSCIEFAIKQRHSREVNTHDAELSYTFD